MAREAGRAQTVQIARAFRGRSANVPIVDATREPTYPPSTAPAGPGMPPRRVLLAVVGFLAVTDLVCLGLHLSVLAAVGLDVLGEHGARYFRLDYDRGFAESFGYLKLGWAALLALGIARRAGCRGLVVWAALLAALLADDAVYLHERFGGKLAPAWGSLLGVADDGRAGGVRLADLGELTVVVVLYALPLAAVTLAHWLGGPAYRALSRRLAGCLALLAFFGVAVDVVHELPVAHAAYDLLIVVEDGGELVAMTLLLAVLAAAALGVAPTRQARRVEAPRRPEAAAARRGFGAEPTSRPATLG